MNTVKKDILKGLLAASLVVISFFLGMLFTLRNTIVSVKNTDIQHIIIETKKDSIEIVSIPENTSIIVDGKNQEIGSIELR